MKFIFGSFIFTSVTFSFMIHALAGVVKANENIPDIAIAKKTDRLLSFDYKNFDFWLEQCRMLDNLQKYTEALAACETAIALKPKKKNIELWTARSNALMNLGKYAEAIISYNRVLHKQPNNSSALTRRCQALLALEKNEDAISSCEKALEADANWGDVTPANAWYNMGLAFTKSTKYQKALESFERATLVKPNYSLAFAQQCGALVTLQLYSRAIKVCDTAIQTNGDWGKQTAAIAWKNKALALTRLGQIPEAVNAYKQGLEINPKDAIAWYERGYLQQKLHQYDRALASYKMAVQIKPKYSQALARQAQVLNKLQNYELALRKIDEALAGDAVWGDLTLADIWNQHSVALANLRQYQESIADAERVIALKQDYAPAWNNKAVGLWNLGKYQEAEEASFKATNLNSKYSQAWFNQGRILSSLGKYQAAIDAYEKALKGNLDKDDYLTHASIWNNKGVAHWRLGKYVSALNSINKATKINPKSFAAWYNKGLVIIEWQSFKPNRKKYLYEQALEAYNRANSIEPNNSAVFTGKAMVLSALGRYQEALKYFEFALNINPNNNLAQQERDKLLNNFEDKVGDR
ncbi:MAG: tetratricopeptide repeat protein [Cyanobacteria bacterium J06639_18]